VSALADLALRCGIEPSYRDAHGALRSAGADTQRALLAAMGVPAASEAQAHAALEALDRAEWARVLPPVIVTLVGAVAIPVVTRAAMTHAAMSQTAQTALMSQTALTQAAMAPPSTALTQPAARPILWRLVLEDGAERRGDAFVADLELIECAPHDQTVERRRLRLGEDIPCGYHRLSVELRSTGQRAECVLIVSPGRCFLPDWLEAGGRAWGITAQLYLLRSRENWGIGDFGDLRRLAALVAARGGDLLGINPLHALFLDAPEHASPYSPASRLLLNALNIDVAALAAEIDVQAVRTLVASPEFQASLRHCQEAPLVDYAGVARLKVPALRALFACVRADAAAWAAVTEFARERGAVFVQSCMFLALRAHFSAELGPRGADWHAWPDAYRDPQSPQIAQFAVDHAELVDFQVWLQFAADRQLAAAAAAARPMRVGIYRDLAVGADRSGAETWIDPRAVRSDAGVGAPPDIHNPAGQNWGLPPFDPRSLRAEAYRSFIDLVRANMRHAGGLRIDHVMGLQHLYWVPEGHAPPDGAYVRYPFEDLIAILALESHRQRCIVVGEDLGTVPQGFRERMGQAGVFSYRVLLFEKDDEGFIAPDRYPRLALAVAGSHDLPTLHGWWQSIDVDLKRRHGLYPTEGDARAADSERERDRTLLAAALRRAGVIDDERGLDVETLLRAVHAYLGKSRSAFALAQLDDIMDEATPVNLPATSEQHANWRRRMSLTLEELAEHPRWLALANLLNQERGDRAAG
jgi:4-alpha-glucanotransferase